MRCPAGASRCIFDDVNAVTFLQHLQSRKYETCLTPQRREQKVSPGCLFNGGNKPCIIPRVHTGAFEGYMFGELLEQLRRKLPGELLAFNHAQNYRDTEDLCGSCQDQNVFK